MENGARYILLVFPYRCVELSGGRENNIVIRKFVGSILAAHLGLDIANDSVVINNPDQVDSNTDKSPTARTRCLTILQLPSLSAVCYIFQLYLHLSTEPRKLARPPKARISLRGIIQDFTFLFLSPFFRLLPVVARSEVPTIPAEEALIDGGDHECPWGSSISRSWAVDDGDEGAKGLENWWEDRRGCRVERERAPNTAIYSPKASVAPPGPASMLDFAVRICGMSVAGTRPSGFLIAKRIRRDRGADRRANPLSLSPSLSSFLSFAGP